ncbi:MAG: hypothetical protein HS116_12250 [Planctomycetes bacterium]|nr:hypothetical protein [Planctomycetota bacterium]
MSVKFFRLLPRYPFELSVFSEGVGGPEFVREFRQCWKQIPLSSRRAIVRHWKSSARLPLFELSNMWADSEKSFAQVSQKGMELKFSQKDILFLPSGVMQWVIAHELAHVYQKSIGRKPGGSSDRENERDADRIAKEWGFDPSRFSLLVILSETRPMAEAIQELKDLGMA